MVTFTLRQVTAIVASESNPAETGYRVTNEVTAAVDASPAVYVYATATQAFSNYASAADMGRWPAGYEEAAVTNTMFYRLSSVTRTWDTVRDMNVDLSLSIRRLQALAAELNAQQGALVIDRTTVITGA